jgi:hypothetical protein
LREECKLLISESTMLQKIFEHGKDQAIEQLRVVCNDEICGL